MSETHGHRRLLDQLAQEMLQDERVLSAAERQLLSNVLGRALAAGSGDQALDIAVAQRVLAATVASVSERVITVIAQAVINEIIGGYPVGPELGPFGGVGPLRAPGGAPGFPVDPGFGGFPSLGPVRIPGAPGRPAPGFTPWVGPIGPIRTPFGPAITGEVSPSNPGNPPGGQVSPSNPGNPPGAQVSPSNPGNPPGGQVSPSNPGNPPGGQVSPSNPGNPPGGQVSPSNPGNPPGGRVDPRGLSDPLAGRTSNRVPGVASRSAGRADQKRRRK